MLLSDAVVKFGLLLGAFRGLGIGDDAFGTVLVLGGWVISCCCVLGGLWVGLGADEVYG